MLRTIRLGVVAVFGIVVPGVWFWGTTVFYLGYGAAIPTIDAMRQRFVDLASSPSTTLIWVLGFVLVYVTGSVLRILPPDIPDRISLRWINFLSEKLGDKSTRIERSDRFPYKSLPAYLRSRELDGLAQLVPWDAEDKNGCDRSMLRSKTFMHFTKLFIASKNAHLADHLARQEAFIRLLAGVFYAFVLSSLVLVGAFISALFHQAGWTQLAGVSLVVFGVNLSLSLGILHAFHYQRLRELVMILSVYFLVGPAEEVPYARLNQTK